MPFYVCSKTLLKLDRNVFMSHFKNIFHSWNLVSGPLVYLNNQSKNLLENKIFNISKSVCRLTQIFSHGEFSKNRKGTRSLSKVTFFVEFYDRNFSFVILHKLAKFHKETVFTSQIFSKMYFLCHAYAFDNVIKFKIPKYWNQKELL